MYFNNKRLISVIILLIIAVISFPIINIFGQDSVSSTESELIEEILNSIDPEKMIYEAASDNKVLIYGEIHSMAQPKKLLVRTIEKLHQDHGYNYLALEIGEVYQPIVDEYLETGNELLLEKNPWVLFSPWHASEDYIKIYKSVYWINQLSENKMKIICIDYDPIEYSSDKELLADRDRHMMEVLDQKVFLVDDEAKVIIFAGAYHGLKNNVWEYMSELDPDGLIFKRDPLGVHLNERFPKEIFSIYIDGIIPERLDENGIFQTEVGTIYKEQLISMVPIPFAIIIDNNIAPANFNVLSKIPIAGNFDGYIFTGMLEELKRIDFEDNGNKY